MKNKMMFLVLSVCIITPFANDIFIASFPEMGQTFNTSHIGLVMTVFMIGLATAQLFYGPLLDRFGRKPVLVTGLVIYTLASLMIVFSTSFHMLLIGRFFQAIGTCSSIVAAMAIARDVYKKEDLVKAMAMIMAIIGICPAIAPLLGSVLQELFGWHGAFMFLLLLGVFYLLVISFLFKESIQQKNMHATKPKQLYDNYLSLLKIKSFQGYILTSACSYGVLFSYAAASSMLIIGVFHFSVLAFGIIFAVNSLAIVIMSILAPKLNKRFSISQLVLTGAILLVIGAALTILLNVIFTSNIYTLVLPMWITTLGYAMIRPTASAGAISSAPHHITGSAAALFNFMSFLGGAIATFLLTQFTMTSIHFATFVLVIGLLAIICARHAHKGHSFELVTA
ncbi:MULTISPECIES: multidrug effflux MFS transporter [Cysteiniphilum]|uniref:Bcr/CflA family efflux transporter n=1 Tax=Cysteiniphilum litorale TaxID=2056700 RepID=A0A8J3EAD3_9GAMM|nr:MULTISPECIES: multidrug effflux MFS transporter [Cysteiniphilum]GGG05455.1 Bcr/CflA family drug resistance efflux transporter [Cysteiniphilum litorale]